METLQNHFIFNIYIYIIFQFLAKILPTKENATCKVGLKKRPQKTKKGHMKTIIMSFEMQMNIAFEGKFDILVVLQIDALCM